MEMSFGSRLKHAWNAFTGNVQINYRDLGMSYSYRADRPRLTRGNERSIVTSVYNRIALDVAALNFQHIRLDENGRFLSVIEDGLNNCLTLEANIDQTARSFIQDVVISMFDEGSVAIVPVDTTTDPNVSGSYDIQTMRVGQILDWYPQYIRVRLYNEQTGKKEDIVVPKSATAIIENPLYAVINEPNSTMQRLIRKLNLLDVIDEQSGSGKLDLIIQLPYVIKTEARRQQAENRRKDIENQLSGTKYGIAYTDGTERITQLNRSVNNNLMSQIEYLTSMLYSQLGITQSILDGTADEKTMLNYNNRTIEPIASAIVGEMKRKFLTKTARSQLQSISFFRDPFKLVPVNEIAEIADKFTRNEIMTSNEIRQVIGMKPSDDPRADELRNKNLSAPSEDKVPNSEVQLNDENEEASDLDGKISKQNRRSKEEIQNE
jgi:hypothetical protein|nr:MAG TPA: portal protein [Caudoviricetes sp.]